MSEHILRTQAILAGIYCDSNPGPLFEVQTSPTDFARILSIRITGHWVGTGGITFPIGIGVPAARGVGQLGASVLRSDSGDTSSLPSIILYASWTTPPTIPVTFLRRSTTQNNITNARQWIYDYRFVRGLSIPPSSSLVGWSITGTNANRTDAGLRDVEILVDA